MPFSITDLPIISCGCDALVNPTDYFYSGSNHIDHLIHILAGPKYCQACNRLAALKDGEVRCTSGYGLSEKSIIHTVVPIWHDGNDHEEEKLRDCYLNSLRLAEKKHYHSIAIPILATGKFGFPSDRVVKIAWKAISDFLRESESDMHVILSIPDKKLLAVSHNTEEQIQARFLLYNGVEDSDEKSDVAAYFTTVENADFSAEEVEIFKLFWQSGLVPNNNTADESADYCSAPTPLYESCSVIETEFLDQKLKEHDDSFAVTLLKLIDQSGMSDVECYKKANVSRKTFSKIMNEKDYRPSKNTVLCFAIALHLDLEATAHLLQTVGLALSRCNRFDIIVEAFIEKGQYDIYEINAMLYKYDQPCLGC